MRRSSLFWAVVLILIGSLLLLDNLDVIRINFWQVLWPILLMAFGLWVLIGTTQGWGEAEVEHVSVPLEGVEQAQVVVDHGVGPVRLAGATGPGELMSGSFAGGLRYELQRSGAALNLKMKMHEGGLAAFWPWGPWDKPGWDFRLSKDIPLSLKVAGGAGMIHLDLRDLRVTELKMDGSVGTANVTMPARAGHTRVQIEGGVGAMTVRIPEGVAARIETSPGLGSITVSQGRFPVVGEHCYQSPNYGSAANRVDMRIEGGVGAVTVS